MESLYLAAFISDSSYSYESLLLPCDKNFQAVVGFR